MTSGVTVADLKHLNPLENLPDDHFLTIIYGVRRSGKTTMLKQLVYDLYPRMQKYEVHVFCSTASFNASVSYDWVPKKAIVSDTSDIEARMSELLGKQKEKLEKLAKEGKIGSKDKGSKGKKPQATSNQGGSKGPQGKRSNPNHAHEREKKQKLTEAAKFALKSAEEDDEEIADLLVIMDDVCSEDSIRYAKSMGVVAMNGRHYRISCIILSQMADMVMIVQAPPQLNERKLLAEWYLTRQNEGDARKAALKTLENITGEDYRALCCAVTSHEREVKKYCYYYGPVPDPFPFPDWKMGTEKQWREEQETAEVEHDFFKKHAIKPMLPEEEAQFKMTAGMQVARNYDITFNNTSLIEKKAPFRLLPSWQKAKDVTPR